MKGKAFRRMICGFIMCAMAADAPLPQGARRLCQCCDAAKGQIDELNCKSGRVSTSLRSFQFFNEGVCVKLKGQT